MELSLISQNSLMVFLQNNSSCTPPPSASPSVPTTPPVLSSQVAASTPVPAAPLLVLAPSTVSLPVATLITPHTSVDTRATAAPSVPNTVDTRVAIATDTIAAPVALQSVMPEFLCQLLPSLTCQHLLP